MNFLLPIDLKYFQLHIFYYIFCFYLHNYYKDYYYLLFSTWRKAFSENCQYLAGSGLYGFRCKNLGSTWEPLNGNAQILANGETLYDVRMVCYRQDTLMALGWLNYDQDGEFIGKLSHPIPFSINDSVLKPTYHS